MARARAQFSLSDDFFKGKNILEVGCTSGGKIHGIVDASFKIGLDPLANIFSKLYPKNADHIRSIGEKLPFKHSSFDIVICLNTLDHTQNPSEVLKETHRCLKKKTGILLLSANTFRTLKTVLRRLHFLDKVHPHHFADSEISCLIGQLGFAIRKHCVEKYNLHYAIKYSQAHGIIAFLKILFSMLVGMELSWFMVKIT